MPRGARIGSVVTFVAELDRSVSFYTDVLGLRVADASPTAALLVSDDRSELVLRAMGSNATHALGSVGVQYVIWNAADKEDLDRCELALKQRSAHRDTRTDGNAVAVEGRDPDDITVVIVYPGASEQTAPKLPLRIYGW
jgi:catechol 2,3-dioxygenase-like lactoylglutathione lyase family enzyme